MKLWTGVIVFALCTVGLAAQGPAAVSPAAKTSAPAAGADKAAIEKALVANEMKINNLIVKGDPAALKDLIADDAWTADDGGFMSVADFLKMLKPGVAKITDMKLDQFKVLWIGADTAVLTYVWTGKGTYMDQPVTSPTYSSTVYAKRGTKWLAVYHQETGAKPAPKK
jgi:hypothetical protein